MKTWKRALALVLALVMALSLVALPSFAEGEETGGDTGMPYIKDQGGKVEKDGLVMSKTIKKGENGQFLLTLEAYATGSTTTTSTKPVDIVLVLDVSGSMDEYMETHVTKMDNLKTAVNGFIDSVAKKSPNSSIAIVKFAGKTTNRVGNNTYDEGIWPFNETYNYSQIVQSLTTVNEAGASSLQTAVNGLEAAGATRADYGMQHAQTIINSVKDNGRQKVVIMFTDGNPTSGNKFEDTVANGAIAASKSIKEAGATVYTIGCFGTTPSSDTDTYMNYVSSNYPEATSMTSGGAKADPANYYKTVSSAADLNNIFQDISHTVGGTTVKLTSTSVLRDVISDSFNLPEGADENSITAYSVDCTAINNDGTYTWSTDRDDAPYSVTVEGKTINVTGFDYAANWVGKDTTTGRMHAPAKKLVVEIPIVPEQDATGSVKTNGDASGIYADSTVKDPVQTFPSPVVYIPYFTVTHVASSVDSATGANKGVVGASENYPLWCHKEFNLTSVVTEGYLYGGTFNEETCTTVHNDVQKQGNPMKLNPTENATYYIWEVPDTYLRPSNYRVARHIDGVQTLCKLYPLTTADRLLYKEVGFSAYFGNDTASVVDIKSGSNNAEFETPVANPGAATVYQMVKAARNGKVETTVYVMDGKLSSVNADITDGTANGKPIDPGYIGGARLTDDQFAQFKNDGITYTPYWITLDGVKVTGTMQRNLTFDASKPNVAQIERIPVATTCTYVEDTPAVRLLNFATAFNMDDSQTTVDTRITVTVQDGASTYTTKVQPGDPVELTPNGQDGKLFAGWYVDGRVSDLSGFTADTTVVAKYVDGSYLDLDYSRIGLLRVRGVTLISAVDDEDNYQEVGIMVNGEPVSSVRFASRYMLFNTPSSMFGVARGSRFVIADQSLYGSGALEVTPYWITMDGTTVLGQSHTLHYTSRSIWE